MARSSRKPAPWTAIGDLGGSQRRRPRPGVLPGGTAPGDLCRGRHRPAVGPYGQRPPGAKHGTGAIRRRSPGGRVHPDGRCLTTANANATVYVLRLAKPMIESLSNPNAYVSPPFVPVE